MHTPEFAFEKDLHNVEQAVRGFGIKYPVAMDNDYAIWNAYKNKYWPAHYLIDAQGRVRGHHAGEGNYRETEQMIVALLKEANGGRLAVPGGPVAVQGEGATAAASADKNRSPETYLGYARLKNFSSLEAIHKDVAEQYTVPDGLQLNHWALDGSWLVSEHSAILKISGGSISYRFHGRDLHLVLGAKGDAPVRFKVTLDGVAPGAAHGADIDAQGNGEIRGQRLYQLIRQNGEISDHVFTIQIFGADAEAFAFTFG